MRELSLQPNKIIVPGEYGLGNESVLKIYFRVFDRGHSNDFPPTIVTAVDFLDKARDRLEEVYSRWESKYPDGVAARRKDYEKLFQILRSSPFILLDGNHKGVAATLTHNSIRALEVQNDEDLYKLENMIESGEIFDFKRPEKNLDDLKFSFTDYCLGMPAPGHVAFCSDTSSTLRYTKTLLERVDALASNGELPAYMKQRFLQGTQVR
jgi:hypothetical protein